MKSISLQFILIVLFTICLNCIKNFKGNESSQIETRGCSDSLVYNILDTTDVTNFSYRYVNKFKTAFLNNNDYKYFRGIRIYVIPAFKREYLIELNENDSLPSIYVYYSADSTIKHYFIPKQTTADTIYLSKHHDSNHRVILSIDDLSPNLKITKVNLIDKDLVKSIQDSLNYCGIDSMDCVEKKNCFTIHGTLILIEVYRGSIQNKFVFESDDYNDKRYMVIQNIIYSIIKTID
jgi:hypothetical protein